MNTDKDGKGNEGEKTDYEVGFGRTPKGTRFKPGKSGNPKGRPKGSKNLSTDIRNILRRKVTFGVNGKQETMTSQQALIMRLWEKALKGDVKAITQLLSMAALYNDDPEIVQSGHTLPASDEAILKAFLDRNKLSPPPEDGKPV